MTETSLAFLVVAFFLGWWVWTQLKNDMRGGG